MMGLGGGNEKIVIKLRKNLKINKIVQQVIFTMVIMMTKKRNKRERLFFKDKAILKIICK